MLAFLKPARWWARSQSTVVDSFALVVLVIDGARRGFSNGTVSPALGPNHQVFSMRLTTPVASPTRTSHCIHGRHWQQSGKRQAWRMHAQMSKLSPAIGRFSSHMARLAGDRVPEDGRAGGGRDGECGSVPTTQQAPRCRDGLELTTTAEGRAMVPSRWDRLPDVMALSIASPCLSIQIDAVRPRPHATNKSHPVSSAGGMANAHNSHPRFPAAARHDADCHAGHAGSLVPGSGLHTGGVAKPPSLGSAGGDGGAAIRQATRLRVLSVLVPILSAEGAGAPANPPPMSRKEALGLMFVCLSLPGTIRTKGKPDIGRRIPQNEASDSPLFPRTCHAPEPRGRPGMVQTHISADSSSVFLLVQHRAIHPASRLWSMSASVSSPPLSWNQTWGTRVSLPAGRPWSHQVLRSGTRGCNAGVLACSEMKRECGRTLLAYRFGAWEGTRA